MSVEVADLVVFLNFTLIISMCSRKEEAQGLAGV